MSVLASLVAEHPDAAAVHVALVVESPGNPRVPPVVRAMQPEPAHCAVADDADIAVGAFFTGFAASLAASAAALRACFASEAAAVAAFFCCAVAPGRAPIRAASAAAC
jgi:hypothetical protein